MGHRTLVIGLRAIIKDKRSKPKEKLRACELLREIELEVMGKTKHETSANAQKLRGLLEQKAA